MNKNLETTGDIKRTTQYTRLKRLVGLNRPVSGSHSAVLRRSINRWGNKRVILVVKTDLIDGIMREYIVEGQHYFEAAKLLDLPIFFTYMIGITTKDELIDLIIELNTTQKRWLLKDYVYSLSNILPDYIHLQSVHESTGLSYESIAMLALNNSDRRRMADIIKHKSYRLLNQNFTDMMRYCIDLIDIPQIQGSKRFYPNRLVSEFIKYYGRVREYNHEMIKERVSTNSSTIRGLLSAADDLETIIQDQIFYNIEDELIDGE